MQAYCANSDYPVEAVNRAITDALEVESGYVVVKGQNHEKGILLLIIYSEPVVDQTV